MLSEREIARTKGYVSASLGIYWSKRKITFKGLFRGLNWEALLRVPFARWIMSVNAAAYRCPNCKIVIFSYGKETLKSRGSIEIVKTT